MEIKTTTVSVLVAALGIGAAIAGFVAEATKVKRSQLKVVYVGLEPVCEYPSSPAMGLAIAATVALVIARAIITSTTGGCCSCCQPIPKGPKMFARLCIVISWITSSIAVILFLAGAKLSSQKGVERESNGDYYCYTIKPGVFAGAGIIGLVSVLLGLVYYLLYVSGRNGATEKASEDLELEKPSIAQGKNLTMTDDKKPSVTDGMKPQVSLEKHQV
ncbi:hypothetical protein R6Q59_015363 [Mikania micrantha]|uniref:Uncharacterized protein n=1 Tax=Mikania micrantha TaxID=192012 RepID=A0A5N6LJP6_9ASTR|nr:hypothetical protein E3N88_41760 [Mikania micrantha]